MLAQPLQLTGRQQFLFVELHAWHAQSSCDDGTKRKGKQQCFCLVVYWSYKEARHSPNTHNETTKHNAIVTAHTYDISTRSVPTPEAVVVIAAWVTGTTECYMPVVETLRSVIGHEKTTFDWFVICLLFPLCV